MNTTQLIDSVCAANARMAAALGSVVPAWNPAEKERAEHAIVGDVYRAPDGEWTCVDFSAVDWDGIHTVNPAHLCMVLRRFHVLGPLEAAYRATSDERYAEAARRYIEAFLRDDPPREDWAPGRGDGDTQYDIRLGVWLATISVFRTSPAFDEPFVAQMLDAARGMMRYLVDHVRADRNIRAWHGLVLLQNALRLEALPESAAWRQRGLEISNDTVRRQILPDGAHMEATPGYHGGVLKIVETLWKLARGFPELGLRVPTERVAGMHDYLLASTRPDGVILSLHDTRYAPAVAKPDSSVGDDRAAFRREAGLSEELPAPRVCFPNAAQTFIRDDWSAGSAYLTFDAATRRSFHWHPCRNSLTLFAHGRALLVDPGYTFETPQFPRYGHRTAHHNTVNFSGGDQSPAPAVMRFSGAAGYSLVEGLHGGGYWPWENHSYGTGVFGEHHRTLLWIHRRFGVVLDHVYHTCIEGQKPTIESCWQFSEGRVECNPAARQAVTRHEQGNLLMQFPLVLEGTTMSIHSGERDPMRGWLPAEWGRSCIPAPLLRMVTPGYDPWHGDFASVLIPFAGPRPPRVESKATGPDAVGDARRAGCIRIDGGNAGVDLVIWTRRLEHAIDRQCGLSTDASLVHLRLNAAGAVEDGLMADGTYCEFEGKDLSARLTGIDRLRYASPGPCACGER